MKVLLTGFNAFGNVGSNPSQTVVEELERRKYHYQGLELLTAVIPKEFVASGEQIAQLIELHSPDVIIMLGVAAGTEHIALERFALNIDDTNAPDNSGYVPINHPIQIDGPLATMGNFPLVEMATALSAEGTPIYVSNHAGTFVCNHVFYVANYLLAQRGSNALCGFVHIPLPSGGFGIKEITGAIERVMLYLVAHNRA